MNLIKIYKKGRAEKQKIDRIYNFPQTQKKSSDNFTIRAFYLNII